jgi:AcrR family transcriptional regulator
MPVDTQITLDPRKTPVQARSAATVEAIAEATIQVLLSHGIDHLTTTRVAERAGVSVGTLYQYYPNKQALLFAVLEAHLDKVATVLKQVCEESRGLPLDAMVKTVVEKFVDAKMERTDVSTALYRIAAELGGVKLVKSVGERSSRALETMLVTAPGVHFEDAKFVARMMMATMAGTTRAVLEAGASAATVKRLREHLVLLCLSYLESCNNRAV